MVGFILPTSSFPPRPTSFHSVFLGFAHTAFDSTACPKNWDITREIPQAAEQKCGVPLLF